MLGHLFCQASVNDSIQKYEILFDNTKDEQLDSAVYYNSILIAIFEKENKSRGLANRYKDHVGLLLNLNKLDSAKYYSEKTIVLYDKLGLDEELGKQYVRLSDIYLRNREYDLAIEYALQSYHLLDSLNSIDLNSSAMSLALLYLEVADNEKASYYVNEVEESAKLLRIETKEDSLYVQHMYGELGAFFFNLRDYKKSHEYLLKGYQIAKKMHVSMGVFHTALFLSNIYTIKKEVDSAFYYLHEAEIYGEKLGIKKQLVAAQVNHAAILYSQKKYKKALDRLKKARQIGFEINEPEDKMILKNLMTVYMRVNPDSAYYYFKKYDSLSVAELNQKKIEAVYDLEVKYDTEKKTYENQILKQNIAVQEKDFRLKTIIAVGTIVVMILITLIMFLVVNRKKAKAEKELLELEQKLLRTQMNPHFIFNSLATIGSFIRANKKEESYRYITRFGKLMRAILECSREESISLEKEIEIIENFLFLHKLRLGEKLNYQINVDDEIDVEEYDVPPMLLQPFIENAIEHGVEKLTAPSQLVVNVKLKEEVLILEVQDEGKGFKQVEELTSEKDGYKSYAIQITKERIENMKNKYNIDLAINNIEVNNVVKGTKVALSIN